VLVLTLIQASSSVVAWGLVGFARKARNLEQVGESGDGSASEPIANTLKTRRCGQVLHSRVGGKTSTGNVMSGGTGEPGPRGVSRNLREEKAEEGSGRGEG
jgi:hypothetical protein